MRQQNARVIDDPPQQASCERAPSEQADFAAFMLATEPPLRKALVAAYGYEDGREAAAEALAYAWEHWSRVRVMPNAAGYLFRVAQSSAARGRRWRRPPPLLAPPAGTEHQFEPGLPSALASLSERQRIAVVLVYGFGYTLREVAELTGIKITTVQNHLERGLRRLQDRLGVALPTTTQTTTDRTAHRGRNDEYH